MLRQRREPKKEQMVKEECLSSELIRFRTIRMGEKFWRKIGLD